jgi:LPXTG-motif cell wall-anchored protein
VGDKFYYNSPQRPNDETVMKTFYEDAGIQPQTYTAKAGDDIRQVGKELLGDSRSWMEIWATNDVESKHGLDEGTQLRYWPNSDATAAPALAQTEKMGAGAPPPDQAQATDENAFPPQADQPPQVDASQAANPPPQAAAEPPPANDLPPPPDQAQNQDPQAAAPGMVEPPPPPPPPPPDNNMAAQQNPEAGMPGAAGEQDQTMALGVGAVLLLAAAALFISIRKKRQKRQIDFNTSTQTQIE